MAARLRGGSSNLRVPEILCGRLRLERVRAAKKFEQAVEHGLREVAMESAKFQVQITAPEAAELKDEGGYSASGGFSVRGIDRVEFYFSANAGENIKPLV